MQAMPAINPRIVSLIVIRPGVRVFVVQSEERLAYERAMREAAMEKKPAEAGTAIATVESKIAGDIAKAQVDRGWQNINDNRRLSCRQPVRIT
jgi:hypothetical protein